MSDLPKDEGCIGSLSQNQNLKFVDIHCIHCACFESAVTQDHKKILSFTSSCELCCMFAEPNPATKDQVLMVDQKSGSRSVIPNLYAHLPEDNTVAMYYFCASFYRMYGRRSTRILC